MRQHWSLPDEEQCLQLTPDSLLETIDRLGVDTGAKLLILLWRTWQVRNNLTHDSDKLSFAGSVNFLTRYWMELCGIRHRHSPRDAKGKSVIQDSLIAGKANKQLAARAKWETTGIKLAEGERGWCI